MGVAEIALEPEPGADVDYPTFSASDPVYPCQTREVLARPLDGIATPAMWSRLALPLQRALDEIWLRLGLLGPGRPSCWVTLQLGRIAINAHGWERIRARVQREEPDAALILPAESRLQRLPELWERTRVGLGRGRLRSRVRRAAHRVSQDLERLGSLQPASLDSAELARGVLDEWFWTELSLCLLAARVGLEASQDPRSALVAALRIEASHALELGRRLAAKGLLGSAPDIAYLTVRERIQAVHGSAGDWAERVASRLERIGSFTDLDVPMRFWGRPRVHASAAD